MTRRRWREKAPTMCLVTGAFCANTDRLGASDCGLLKLFDLMSSQVRRIFSASWDDVYFGLTIQRVEYHFALRYPTY